MRETTQLEGFRVKCEFTLLCLIACVRGCVGAWVRGCVRRCVASAYARRAHVIKFRLLEMNEEARAMAARLKAFALV
jgi:hypothetical protein